MYLVLNYKLQEIIVVLIINYETGFCTVIFTSSSQFNTIPLGCRSDQECVGKYSLAAVCKWLYVIWL